MISYRMSLIRYRRRTFLLYKETGMQKSAGMLVETGKAFTDPSAMTTQTREDSDFWSLAPLTILCWRTLSVITKHPEDGPGTAQMDNTKNQIDYILVRKRLRSGVNSVRTRSFPEADIGSDNNLLKMTFHICLKRTSKLKHTSLKSDFEKLKVPNVLETFQAMIGEKFAPLTTMNNEDTSPPSTQQ